MISKIAVINDLSGLGRCSLTAAISTISAMGVQPVPLPTAVLSAQTGFSSYYCDDFTDRMDNFTNEWKKLGVKFEGIYSGFVMSSEQIRKIRFFLDEFYREDTLLLVDPILGDDGVPYDFFNDKLRNEIRSLAMEADIITPNLTELALLSGRDYETFGEDYEVIEEAASKLINKPGKKIIVTGIRSDDPETGEPQVGNLLVTKDKTRKIVFKRHGGSYSGTGDLMASVTFAGIIRGDAPEEALRLAGEFIEKSIEETAAAGTPGPEGVFYENYMGMLTSRR
ncbi:MAG: pyridoxamine kinase [Clostridiales bacterium]|nr:pyridoxamine kinase [Clostridiales bacterium]